MQFKENTHFYIHNIGIDYQPIFFSDRHKEFFRKKAFLLISPYAKIIALTLADNQFHILIKTNEDYGGTALNHNIGILLRSYTRAINKERFRVGSLFRRHTRAFVRLSDIPNHLRKFIQPFIAYFKKGQLVNFKNTISNFIDFLNHDILENDLPLFEKWNLKIKEIFNHPQQELKDQLNI